MRRIVFLNRFFLPDHSATSQILGDLATFLCEQGLDVHVIASRQLYGIPNADLPEMEIINGVTVHRVASTRFRHSSYIGRAIDSVVLLTALWRFLKRFIEPEDIIVAKTDPPLLSLLAMFIAARRHARLVNWLQDIYPEIAIQLRVPFARLFASALLSLRDKTLICAEMNVTVGHIMAKTLTSRNIASGLVCVIPNWTDDDAITPADPQTIPLREHWGLKDKFVVGYSGNLGRAHEFETIVGAARRLRNSKNIVFVFIGSGALIGALKHRIAELSLDSMFQFFDYQERSLLRQSLGVPDVHLISLRPELEGLVVPSKIYGIAAAGRPIVAIAAKNGEIGQLISNFDCGSVIEPGDTAALANTLLSLSKNPEAANTMGKRARAMLDEHFARKKSLGQWLSVLQNI